MGVLHQPEADIRLHLPTYCLVGRLPVCDLVLAEKNVSGRHAAIEWTGSVWQIQDIGSRNGTYVENQRITAEGKVLLGRGSTLRFGQEARTWIMTDDGPPVAMARNQASNEWRLSDGGYLVLPGSSDPECSIYQLPDGTWALERGSEVSSIVDRATVSTGTSALWKLFLPITLGSTVNESGLPIMMANLRLRFRYSLDEEQVEMTGFFGERRLDFEIRAHHYPLLLLARHRLAERRAGAPDADAGWLAVDDLLRMLNMGEQHLNICIHRARTQLGQAGVLDAASLIERKIRTRRLRIGVRDLELRTLDGPPAPRAST